MTFLNFSIFFFYDKMIKTKLHYNMIAYHVTTLENYVDIEKNGLVPKIGPRSENLGEVDPRIYLFPDKITCSDALMNWLGEEFDEVDSFIILEVDISKFDKKSDVGYEVTVKEHIPTSHILKVFNEVEFEQSLKIKDTNKKKNKLKP